MQVAMSSTSIVIKCLADARQNSTPHGQITIGTLILQDCMVCSIPLHICVLFDRHIHSSMQLPAA